MAILLDGTSGVTTPGVVNTADETIATDLTFTGTGNRITGDFSNGTIANRVAFQTSTANSNTVIEVIPNGTATQSSFVAAGNSDPTNASVIQMLANGTTDTRLVSTYFGTGTYLPMIFHTGGSARVTIDTSGNVGIGADAVASLQVSKLTTVLSGTGNAFGVYVYPTSSGACYIDALTNLTGVTDLSLRTYNNGTYNTFIGTAGGGTATIFPVGGTERMRINSTGNLLFNSGYGSVATAYGCRAWVNFSGTGSGTFAGGASTVTRIAASTTATITTTTAHGLITGNSVWALTGVVAGAYTVTVLTTTTFTITTVATTVLTAVAITFAVNSIRASGNVSSITDNGVGDYTVNFTTAMPDDNYSISGMPRKSTDGNVTISYHCSTAPTTSACRITTNQASTGALQDGDICSFQIFR